MKTQSIILAVCTLVASSACGFDPKEGSSGGMDGGGTSSTDASATDPSATSGPNPQVCFSDSSDNPYEEGEEFETPDGCVRFRCESGAWAVLTDDRITVEGDLSLSSQQDVDAQRCLRVVTGSLTIADGAADLEPLGHLTRVGESLAITSSEASTLTGLEKLAEVGDITIADNDALTSLSFFPYMSVFGDVIIQNNDALTSLAGAEFIGQCGNCRVSGRHAGSSADDDDAADAGDGGAPAQPADTGDEPQGGSFYGNILIADNDALVDVSALANLVYAWADVRFTNNAALASLDAMPLSQVEGNLEISDHAAMETADVDAFVASILVTGTTTVCGNLGGDPCL